MADTAGGFILAEGPQPESSVTGFFMADSKGVGVCLEKRLTGHEPRTRLPDKRGG